MNLSLDSRIVNACHQAGQKIADDVQVQTADKTTVSIERATLRLCGIRGHENGTPKVNTHIRAAALDGDLADGAGACWHHEAGGLMVARAGKFRERREWRDTFPAPSTPLRYVLTATGDIDQDITHALAVCEAGGDIIAMIRSTGQSLLEHVPEGTEETRHGGTGGTFNNQENLRQMRGALDDWSHKNGRYIRLSSFCSGLCQPEIAAISAIEGLDNAVCDGLYGCLYRDLNLERVLIDTRFARLILGWAGIVINTGEDNYLRTADGLDAAHTVTASQFVNYYLAKDAGVSDAQIGLGDAFEIDPRVEESFTLQLAQALLTRQLFPDCPTKYMPPTRWETGDFWMTQARGVMFDLAGVLSNQGIMTISVPDEGLHTPHISSRVTGLRTFDYVQRATKTLADNLEVNPNGSLAWRARGVLTHACELLEQIADEGLFAAIERGVFGDVKRSRDGGKGREGIVVKSESYSNPVEALMLAGVS